MKVLYKAKYQHPDGPTEEFDQFTAESSDAVWARIRHYIDSPTPAHVTKQEMKHMGWRVDRVFDVEKDDIEIGIAIAKKAGVFRFIGKLVKGLF